MTNSEFELFRAKGGTREIRYRAEVLRNGSRVRDINISGGNVSLDKDGDILRTAQFDLAEPINELSEELKLYMMLRVEDAVEASFTTYRFNVQGYTWDELETRGMVFDALGRFALADDVKIEQWREWPLGVFVPSTPTRTGENGENKWSVEAYDRTVILKEDGLSEPLFIAAGTQYIDAIESILFKAGINSVLVVDANTAQIAADRIFEVGTSLLTIINALLDEINYDPIYCDETGRFMIQKYKPTDKTTPDITYAAGELSIIGANTSATTDYYKVPNVFIALCSNPDLQQDYRSMFVDDSPVSPFSTIRRGRRIMSEIYKPEQITEQTSLDDYVARKAHEVKVAASETITFTTAPTIHGRAENVEIRHPDVNGVFLEVSWSLPLDGGEMEHTAKRTRVA